MITLVKLLIDAVLKDFITLSTTAIESYAFFLIALLTLATFYLLRVMKLSRYLSYLYIRLSQSTTVKAVLE